MHIFIICDFEKIYNKSDYLVFISCISFLSVCNLLVELHLGLARAVTSRRPAELTTIFYCLI
jgi:hypothetical protein